MNLFLIGLSLILFNGNFISGANNDELEGIDVLSTLQSSSPTCDLHNFVKNEDEYKALTDDLKKFCSKSDSKQQTRVLCHMVAYELKKACKLDEKQRPSQVKYSTKTTSKEICGLKNIQLTSQWILKAITNNEEKQIGITAKELCEKVTSDENTLQLARFFYKAAPHVRQADLSKSTTNDAKSDSNKQSLGETVVNAAKEAKDTVVDAAKTLKDKAKEVLTNVKNKTEETIEGTKEKVKETGKKINDKVADEAEDLKNKAGDAIDTAKDKVVDGAKKASDKLDETKNDIKDKANEASNAAVNKKDDLGSKAKNKLGQFLDKARAKAGAAADTVKDRVSGDGGVSNVQTNEDDDNEDGDKKTADKTKAKTDADDDTDKDKVEDDTNDAKKKTEEVNDNVKKPLTKTSNGTKDDGSDTAKVNEQQKVLDVKQGKKPETDDDNEDEKDDDDNTNDKAKSNDLKNKPKTDDQDKQIPKPSLSDKDDPTKKKKPTAEEKNKTPIGRADDGEDEDGGEKDDANDDNQPDPNELNRKNVNNDKKASNKDGDDIQFRKPNEQDKKLPVPSVQDPKKTKTGAKPVTNRKYSSEDGWSGNFITYFLMFTLFVVVGYLFLHNKNKLMAYALEGSRSTGTRTGSRPSHRGYEKLRNVNDIIPIDDTNPVSDKDSIILKA